MPSPHRHSGSFSTQPKPEVQMGTSTIGNDRLRAIQFGSEIGWRPTVRH